MSTAKGRNVACFNPSIPAMMGVPDGPLSGLCPDK
jgi:hypothetical protein